MTTASPDPNDSRRATSLLLALFLRSWPTIVALAVLRSVWFVAFPSAIVSVGTSVPPWAPLVVGALLDLIGMFIQQRLRRVLRTTSMVEAARDALLKSGGVPETDTDAAFWSVWLTEYAMSQDVPGILAASVGTAAILVVAAVRMGFGLILPVTAVLAFTAILAFVLQRRLRPSLTRVVDTRVVAASWVAAAERDGGEISGPQAVFAFLDKVASTTRAWCLAEDATERKQRVQRIAVILLLGAGLVATLAARGIDWLTLAIADASLRVTVREVSDLLLIAASIQVALTAARHLGSLLTGHAELSRLRPPMQARQDADVVCWNGPPREIVVRNLVVRHDGHLALRVPALVVSLNKPLAIAGPNGSGKTSFASVLTGVLAPSEGEVTIGGVLSTRLNHDAVAFVPQDPVLIESLTIAENVRLVAPTARDEEIVAKLRELELNKQLEHKAGELSRGERRRIAIARALLKDPMLLVLDEPDTWLDTEGRAVLTQVIRLEAHNRAIVIVSHRPDVLVVAGRIVSLTAEHLVEVEGPECHEGQEAS